MRGVSGAQRASYVSYLAEVGGWSAEIHADAEAAYGAGVPARPDPSVRSAEISDMPGSQGRSARPSTMSTPPRINCNSDLVTFPARSVST